MEDFQIAAPAKINLILSVGEHRPDGYHDIWSVMQMLDLHDSITFSWDQNVNSLMLSPADLKTAPIFFESFGIPIPTDEDNLVLRAVRAVMLEVGLYRKLHIQITKRIPVAAGLGGGSSDAAATIQALNGIFGLGWELDDCARVGASLGSDVPFFFYGPTSIVSGGGEKVFPVKITTASWVVLVKPSIDIATAWAYRELDSWRSSRDQKGLFVNDLICQEFLALPRSSEELYPYFLNSFQDLMEAKFPLLEALRKAHLSFGADTAMLSGSGSSVFGVYPTKSLALKARQKFFDENDCQAFVTQMKIS